MGSIANSGSGVWGLGCGERPVPPSFPTPHTRHPTPSSRHLLAVPIADIDEVPLDRRGRRHLRADQVCPAAAALAPLEITVRGGRAALAGLQDVRVHSEAHRAAGAAPVEAGGAEHLVETLGLGLRLHLL